jgi:3-hydroxyisobutyrate dehydrogenase-like beta-hydroxyacid dehydrogenase
MSKVSVLGSGLMGSALTRALLKGGHEVQVFDLDLDKTKPLAAAGATVASNAVELLKFGDFFIPSVTGYEGLQGLLEQDGVLPAMKGKTILQLSSGPPTTVRAFGEYIAGTGVHHLEGRIKSYPKDIGRQGSKIIFAGQEELFEQAKPVTSSLAEHLVYLGPRLETVAVIDEAVVTATYGQIWALMLGGKMCKDYGVSPLILLDIIKETTQLNLEDVETNGYPDLINGEFKVNTATSTISAWVDAGDKTLEAIRGAKLDTTIFEAIHSLVKDINGEGRGDRALFSIVDVMGTKESTQQ